MYILTPNLSFYFFQGPSGKDAARDSTAFEKAGQEWGKASVSHRGKVGGGDHKSEAWLG